MKRNIRRYFKDQWNVLDLLGILCLLVGMIIIWYDSMNPWGPAFYGLSAPLVVSRVLFFAQILQFQGPMIQVSECPILLYSLRGHSLGVARAWWRYANVLGIFSGGRQR